MVEKSSHFFNSLIFTEHLEKWALISSTEQAAKGTPIDLHWGNLAPGSPRPPPNSLHPDICGPLLRVNKEECHGCRAQGRCGRHRVLPSCENFLQDSYSNSHKLTLTEHGLLMTAEGAAWKKVQSSAVCIPLNAHKIKYIQHLPCLTCHVSKNTFLKLLMLAG